MLLGAVALLITGLLLPLNIWLLMIPLMITFFFILNLFAASMSLCLSLFPHVAAMAGAAMAAIFMLITGLIGAFASVLRVDTQTPLAIVYIVVTLVCLFIGFIYVRISPADATEKWWCYT